MWPPRSTSWAGWGSRLFTCEPTSATGPHDSTCWIRFDPSSVEATEESFDEVMRTNLAGPYFLTQACAAWMIEQQATAETWSGCVVNITSMSASVVSTNRGEYCVSKAGLSMATKLWATRLGEFGIPVYEVRPGIIRTDMTSAVEETYSELLGEGLTIQKRWGTPDDVGAAVAALVRGEIPYATGQVLCIDGGLTVQRL